VAVIGSTPNWASTTSPPTCWASLLPIVDGFLPELCGQTSSSSGPGRSPALNVVGRMTACFLYMMTTILSPTLFCLSSHSFTQPTTLPSSSFTLTYVVLAILFPCCCSQCRETRSPHVTRLGVLQPPREASASCSRRRVSPHWKTASV